MSNLQKAKDAMKAKTITTSIAKAIAPNVTAAFHAATTNQPTNIANLQNQIKNIRNIRCWTQRDLASKAQISQGTIARAEKNLYVSLRSLIRIANALGCQLTIS